MSLTPPPRSLRIAVAVCGVYICLQHVRAAENDAGKQTVLHVPVTDSVPVVDGRLDDRCWENAAKTGPFGSKLQEPSGSQTETVISRDAEHLYVGVLCSGPDATDENGLKRTSSFTPGPLAKHAPSTVDKLLAAHWAGVPLKPSPPVETVELLIDSNGDPNSFYLIQLTPENDGTLSCSYHEHDPPWCDRTWQPDFPCAVAKGTNAWAAEFALPLEMFNKNTRLSSRIGFNIRRANTSGGETHGWQVQFGNPGDAGILAGIPARESLPKPEYVKPTRNYRAPVEAKRTFLEDEGRQTLQLGPGSAHPSTTGEVRLEFEGFLLEGDPHAWGFIWDLAVNERTGELYVLFDARLARGMAELRVYDRQGKYLRTVMPLNPTLPRSQVQDLCRRAAREGGTDLVIPILFPAYSEFSIYGDWWHHPQKMALPSDGELMLSNIYRGVLWRMGEDGSLPAEGWTSIYNRRRNEPFESATWTHELLMVQDLKNYLPFRSLHYPYFCFGPDGSLYVSAGQSSKPTRRYGYYFEVSEQQATYHWQEEDQGATVWKCRVGPGPKIERLSAVAGFAEPSGLVHDGRCLIVADAGNNRLQVIDKDGRAVKSITHYQHDGQSVAINGPTALAIDRDKHLYVLVAANPRPEDPRVERTMPILRQAVVAAARKPPEPPRTLIKLKSWEQPELVAAFSPVDPDVLQIAVDSGVSPPLVWVANGAGPGSLVQLDGDDLSVKQQWSDNGDALSCPRQSGGQPILNIDPETGHVYVEDDSNHRLKQFGTVYRLDQQGNVLKKWPPFFFDARELQMTSPWGTLNYERQFRHGDEPLCIESIFGKDGRVYRWRLGSGGVEILRFDRAGEPVPFSSTGTNALFVDHAMKTDFWHDTFHGMDVDRHGNIYYVAKVDVEQASRPVSPYVALHRQINVYDADGKRTKRGLLQLDCVRGLQVDDAGNLYVVHRPAERPWRVYLALSKFSPTGGEPLWSRRWDGYMGQAEVYFEPCHCSTSRIHQSLDGKGYLYVAGKYSIQVISCETGELVGEFGSYGNMDCRGKGSEYPHPELPFGTIAALSVWQDRLFAVDVVNRRVVKCRIVYD